MSSLAAKYYVSTLTGKWSPYVSFGTIYDGIDNMPSLARCQANLSQGICLPDQEIHVTDSNLPYAIIHNKEHHNAHHDIIIPVFAQQVIMNVAVQAKASFSLSTPKEILLQLQSHKGGLWEPVPLLIWLYLGGDPPQKQNYPNVVFIDGSGCCNGLAFDQYVLLKRLKSLNNK